MSYNDIFLEFQKQWNLERVKQMTLEEYTSMLSVSSNRDDFTFWIESRLDKMGSIWGGSSFKFGIYRQNNNESKESGNKRCYDEQYGWLQKYGNNAKEAFETIKQLIIQIIISSQNNDLEAIDKIDLGDAFKWKIAFHYQNIDDIKIVDIFRKEVVNKIKEDKYQNVKMPTSQLHAKLLDGKKYNLTDIISKGIELWKQYGDENQSNDKKENENNIGEKQIPLNQILYGSPATGKTHSTIDKALEILASYDENLKLPSKEDRKARKKLFEDYRQKGQIEFITFHQSYGYEEFVEGIKPIPTEDGENVKYEIKNGIFKTICSNAGCMQEKLDDVLFDTKSRVWKISLGGNDWKEKTQDLQDYCFKNNEIRIGWGDASENDETFKKLGDQQKKSVQQFKHEMKIGDLVCVLNTVETIKAIGIIESNFYFDKDSQFSKKLSDFYSTRKVKWIDQSIRNILSLNNGTKLTLKTVYPLKKISPIDLLSFLQDKKNKTTISNTQKPHILIIDEINRGNISKIFGELITLIEPSKRIGASEELKVKLPYSGTSDEPLFGVPSNLYIIGTMNTADRSITSLDIALRRRFEFVEMMPKPDELKDLKVQGTKINLKDMLEQINKRIEFLYDREKTIGHAFFLSECKEGESSITLEQLKGIFQNKIIPLLQEYFYNDYALIQAVLNSNRMIEKEEEKTGKLFAIDSLVNELDLENKPIYKIADYSKSGIWDNEKTYIALYKNEVARELNNPNKQNTTDTEVKD